MLSCFVTFAASPVAVYFVAVLLLRLFNAQPVISIGLQTTFGDFFINKFLLWRMKIASINFYMRSWLQGCQQWCVFVYLAQSLMQCLSLLFAFLMCGFPLSLSLQLFFFKVVLYFPSRSSIHSHTRKDRLSNDKKILFWPLAH